MPQVPDTLPQYNGQDEVEHAYEQAERTSSPFYGIEQYDDGYAVTFDLLPAGPQLSTTARKEVGVRLTTELEAVVGDDAYPTTEASKSVNDSLVSVSLFTSEEGARRIAQSIAPVVLASENWTTATR